MTAPSAPKPRFMREEIVPVLPPDLEAAIDRRLETASRESVGVRLAAAVALRRIGLPHSGSEDFSFIRVGELLPFLGPTDETMDAGSKAREVSPSDDTSGADAAAAQARILPSAADLENLVSPEAKDNLVVLLDGIFIPELSRTSEDFFVAPLEDSAPPDSPLPGMHLRFQGLHAAFLSRMESVLEEEYDAPSALAAFFAVQPLLIRMPAKRVAAAPLQILHLTTDLHRSDAANRSDSFANRNDSFANRNDSFIVLHAGAQSESRILVRHARLGASQASASPMGSAGNPVLENVHTLAILEEGASLRFLEQGIDSADAGRDLHLRKLSARLERDARLVAVSAHTGSRLTRTAFGIDLAGEGADAELNGAAVLSAARQGHVHVRLRHLVPHGTSRQMFKTVAADQARASVDGTILVAVDAQQTNAGQRIHNLMLSDEARADSKPRLMIHADDVKCSHGATAGKLDAAQQFYLESRGLPPDQARSLLTVAFIAEALGKAGNPGEPFRAALDHALLDGLRARLPRSESDAAPTGVAPGDPHA